MHYNLQQCHERICLLLARDCHHVFSVPRGCLHKVRGSSISSSFPVLSGCISSRSHIFHCHACRIWQCQRRYSSFESSQVFDDSGAIQCRTISAVCQGYFGFCRLSFKFAHPNFIPSPQFYCGVPDRHIRNHRRRTAHMPPKNDFVTKV
jgi:hypothetical protein